MGSAYLFTTGAAVLPIVRQVLAYATTQSESIWTDAGALVTSLRLATLEMLKRLIRPSKALTRQRATYDFAACSTVVLVLLRVNTRRATQRLAEGAAGLGSACEAKTFGCFGVLYARSAGGRGREIAGAPLITGHIGCLGGDSDTCPVSHCQVGAVEALTEGEAEQEDLYESEHVGSWVWSMMME